MGTVINYLRGLFGAPATLDENQIVANICQHVNASVVQLKYSMVFDAFLDVLLEESIYQRVRSDFGAIFLDVRNIEFKHLKKLSKKYHPYILHCENFIIHFSAFKEGDDLSDVVGKNEAGGAMYIVSRRQENAASSENAEKRITKISKMSRVLDAYSIRKARACGYEIKSDHRFSAPLDGFKTDMGITVVKADTDAKKNVCWGKLYAMGTTRFEGTTKSEIGLYHNPVRIGGSDTPSENNGIIGYRLLDAGNIPYAVLSKEGDAFFISGTGILNGEIHLAPDVRRPLPDGSKILLGNQQVMFNSSTV